jgi:hypothetical protein
LNRGLAVDWGCHSGHFQCGTSWMVADEGRDLGRSGTGRDWGKRGEGKDYSTQEEEEGGIAMDLKG